jgi:hypothetical protein
MPNRQPSESASPATPDLDTTTPAQSGGVNLQGNVTIHGDVAGRDIRKIINNFFSGGSDEQRVIRNRRAMLALVKTIWVKGVLEKSGSLGVAVVPARYGGYFANGTR